MNNDIKKIYRADIVSEAEARGMEWTLQIAIDSDFKAGGIEFSSSLTEMTLQITPEHIHLQLPAQDKLPSLQDTLFH